MLIIINKEYMSKIKDAPDNQSLSPSLMVVNQGVI